MTKTFKGFMPSKSDLHRILKGLCQSKEIVQHPQEGTGFKWVVSEQFIRRGLKKITLQGSELKKHCSK